jgi:polar amino acid transport system substrate-binding protein
LAEDAPKDIWDLALLAVEPARATVIDFTNAYLEIESSYLVPEGSSIHGIDDVDKPGVKIAVMEKSAYDLYLTRSIKHATLVHAKSMDESFEIFVSQQLDALAGLKPRLIQEEQKLKGSKMLPGRFTAVQQAMGVPKGKSLAANFIGDFIKEAISSGLVQKIIDGHQIKGVSVAALLD